MMDVDTLKSQVMVLEEVSNTYPTSTIENAIRQIKSRIKYLENGN